MKSRAARQKSLLTPSDLADAPDIRVTWVDAWCDLNEVDFGGVQDGLKVCVDRGVLVKKTKRAVVLSQSTTEEDNTVRYTTSIPMSLVLKIEKVASYETVFERKKAQNAQETAEAA